MSVPPQPARISVLPGLLVNQIAAGEVIERPASVIKELTENSIDAGATRIDIEVHAGGAGAIIVRDNGSGIHPDDIELAVMRHATSKLRSREDLDTIWTLGFRGEALSSVASVSLFSIISRTADDEYARHLNIDPAQGGTGFVPAAHPVGTTIEVRNLFYNVPARRKFLRSERTEFLHVLETVKHLVMSRPDIHIQLRHDGKTILNCPAVESDFYMRLRSVLGSSFAANSRPVEASAGAMHLYGWMGLPAAARSQSDQQYFYLNNRIIRDRQVTHAIRMATEPDFPAARYPAYVLYLRMDPSLVDVNVHPTKQEVRFRYPREVHDFIYAALRNEGIATAVPGSATVVPPDRLPNRPPGLQEAAAVYHQTAVAGEPPGQPLGAPVAVLNTGYVVAVTEDGLRIIDFNRLRAASLQARLQQDVNAGATIARPLLVPVIFNVAAADLPTLSAGFEQLDAFGLRMELSGPQSIMIRSLPALLPDLELEPLLREIPALLREPAADPAVQQRQLIGLLIKHGGLLSARHYSLQQIADQLRHFATTGSGADGPDTAGLWRTLSTADLQALLNNDR